MAMMPPLRILAKSPRFDFFTMPLRVAKRMCFSGFHVVSTPPAPPLVVDSMRIVAAICSPDWKFKIFAIDFPLAVRLISGIS